MESYYFDPKAPIDMQKAEGLKVEFKGGAIEYQFKDERGEMVLPNGLNSQDIGSVIMSIVETYNQA